MLILQGIGGVPAETATENATPATECHRLGMNTNTRPAATAPWFNTAERSTQRRHLVGRLYEQHHAAVVDFAERLGAQRADAEDISSIVFEIAFRRLESFRGEASPRTWLFGIARRVSADRRRSATARLEHLVERSPTLACDDSPETELLVAEENESVTARVKDLPAPQRRIVTDFMLRELPMAEVAQRARIPLQTAYARLYSGQRQLASVLRACA
jgi:RNA polymerase sigma-70 factor, ECF subfamily